MHADEPLKYALRTFLKRRVPARAKILIAISGGPDSVALTHLLASLIPTLPLKLHLAHLDHGLRASSKTDAEFVRKLGQELGLPVTIQKILVRQRTKATGEGVEEAARELRYRALADIARRIKARWVAVGHTLNDQAETVLFRILRGSGPTGLSGMEEVRPLSKRVSLIRPLLNVPRAELVAHLKRHQFLYRVDPSNATDEYARNRIRRNILPLLERENPGVQRHLAQLATVLGEEERFWEGWLRPVLKRVFRRKNGAAFLDLKQFIRYDRSPQRRILRSVVDDASYPQIEALLALSKSASGKRLWVPKWIVEKHKTRLIFRPD